MIKTPMSKPLIRNNFRSLIEIGTDLLVKLGDNTTNKGK